MAVILGYIWSYNKLKTHRKVYITCVLTEDYRSAILSVYVLYTFIYTSFNKIIETVLE